MTIELLFTCHYSKELQYRGTVLNKDCCRAKFGKRLIKAEVISEIERRLFEKTSLNRYQKRGLLKTLKNVTTETIPPALAKKQKQLT